MSIDIQSTSSAVVVPAWLRATPDRPATFQSVQAGRGLAALLVVLFHADRVMTNPAYWHARALGGFFACGHAGVEFFFVLSGFIIAHVHRRDIGQPARLGRFVARRFDRIYPLYWLVLSGVVVLMAAGVDIASLRHVGRAAITASYLLAGADSHGGVLTVSWTLFHEVLFYAVFAAAIADRRAGIVAAGGWLALIAIAATAGTPLPTYVTSPLNLLFAAGIVVEAAVRRGRVRHARTWAVVGAAAFAALGCEEAFAPVLPEMARNLLYGLASAVALAGAVGVERHRRIAVPRPLLTLGAASYSVYLVHFPALSVVARLMVRAGLIEVLSPATGLAVLTAAVVGLGVATHVAVERPLLGWVAKRRTIRLEWAAAKPHPTPYKFGRSRDRPAGRSYRESVAKPLFAEAQSST